MNPEDLKKRIASAREDSADPEADWSNDGGMGFGLTAGAKFVSAVIVGGGLGWLIDRWLGTAPVGMLILMVLCFVGAIANVWMSMSKAVALAEAAAARKANPPGGAPDRVGSRDMEESDGKSS